MSKLALNRLIHAIQPLDHSFVSLLALMGDTGLPVVPILQNTVAPSLPRGHTNSASRSGDCWRAMKDTSAWPSWRRARPRTG